MIYGEYLISVIEPTNIELLCMIGSIVVSSIITGFVIGFIGKIKRINNIEKFKG